MLYKGDWMCMTRRVSLKSMSRSKDGRVIERWVRSENVRGVGEGILGWEDALAIGEGISGEGDACGDGGISKAGDACGGGGGSGLVTTWWGAAHRPWLWLAGVELVLGRTVSSSASRFASLVFCTGRWAVKRWRQSTALSTSVICL